MPQLDAIARYLRDHCEPGSQSAVRRVASQQFSKVLIVPCFAEPLDFLQRLAPPVDDSVLTIVVVNAPDNATSQQLQQTLELLQALMSSAPANQLIVDRVTQPLPHAQGVGLARKIGADIALQLIHTGIVASPWLYFTDADARLPADYFQHKPVNTGTLLFEYRHQAEDAELQRRVNLYELHLRYYVRGLELAGSPYAFPTLGSTIAVHASAYAQVRGMPKRNAAEDFYLLNKLAKVAPVTRLDAPVIELAGRLSDRVPFGTGPALARIPSNSEDYLSYAPAVFQTLAGLLEALAEYAATGSWRPVDDCTEKLNALGWQRFAARFDKVSAPEQRQRRLKDWFDGFRTMRYLRLASAEYPQQPLLATLRHGFTKASASAEELLQLLRHNGNLFTL